MRAGRRPGKVSMIGQPMDAWRRRMVPAAIEAVARLD
jgi:hypothetical protein